MYVFFFFSPQLFLYLFLACLFRCVPTAFQFIRKLGPAAQPGVTRRLDLWNLFHFTAIVVALFFSSISNGIVLTSSPLSYWLSYCLQLLGWTQGVFYSQWGGYTERHHCWYFMETERLRGFPGCARGCCTYPFFFLNDKSSCLQWYAIAISVVFFNKALVLK